MIAICHIHLWLLTIKYFGEVKFGSTLYCFFPGHENHLYATASHCPTVSLYFYTMFTLYNPLYNRIYNRLQTTGCKVCTDLYKNRAIVGKNDKMIRLQIDAVMLRVGGLGDGGGGNRLAAAQCATGWVMIQLFLIYMQNCSSLLYIVWFGDHPGQHAPKLQDMCTRDIHSNFFCDSY